jgi:hypothetical protein
LAEPRIPFFHPGLYQPAERLTFRGLPAVADP